MKQLLLVLFLLSKCYVNAQDVKAYGVVTYRQNPSIKVQIALFERDSLIKKTYSDKKGRFSLRLNEKKTYVLFFYKPSFDIYAYRITNRLDQDLQNIFIEVPLTKSKSPQDSIFFKSLAVKTMNAAVQNQYRLAVDGYLKEKRPKQNLPIDSVREFDRVVAGASEHVCQTKVGSDTYERITAVNNQVRFMKNEKPITEVTFNFETKRRNDGVLKKDKKVKNHSRYKPLRKK